MAPERDLLATVEAIGSVSGIQEFWISTNGILLTEKVSKDLMSCGLSHITVSLAASDSKRYRRYARTPHANFRRVISNIQTASEVGLQVRVAVPVTLSGVHTYEEFLALTELLQGAGCYDIGYFELHKSNENADQFDDLFADADEITTGLMCDPRWRMTVSVSGKVALTNERVEVTVPALKRPVGINCRRNKCGRYCQGNYAAYLLTEPQRVVLRACYREFHDGRNEFEVSERILHREDRRALSDVFGRVWNYTQGLLEFDDIEGEYPSRG